MLKRLEEKNERILEILSELTDESAKGILILVEGKKDAEALRSFGICGKIMTVKTGGKSFLDIVTELENASATKIVLLLDFDRRGKQGTIRLKQSLEHVRIKANIEFWRELLFLAGKDIRCIEALPAYMESLTLKLADSAQLGSIRRDGS